ncbi:hypothetical protein GCM10009785_08840 [Brooklawnia cerclae]
MLGRILEERKAVGEVVQVAGEHRATFGQLLECRELELVVEREHVGVHGVGVPVGDRAIPEERSLHPIADAGDLRGGGRGRCCRHTLGERRRDRGRAASGSVRASRPSTKR